MKKHIKPINESTTSVILEVYKLISDFNELMKIEVNSEREAQELYKRTARVNDLEATLDDVDIALKKMDKGSYGRCEVTGDWIKKERLQAYPAARTCTEGSK